MATNTKLIVGLGNPGGEYEQTRHNAGFWLIDELAREAGCGFRREAKFHGELCKAIIHGVDCWLLKPTTYMNKSGLAVAAVSSYYNIEPENILVLHDEIDLEPGQVKLKRGGGHAGHNGLRDIISAIGSRDFIRVRIGVGHPGQKSQVVGFVLGRPGKAEREQIDASINSVLKEAGELVGGDLQKLMSRLNVG